MRLTLLLSVLLCSQVLFAQKFALIENKGANQKYFDQSNPNSFIGVLLNNIDFLPTLIDQNNYQGVYSALALTEIGVSTDQMLSASTATPLLLLNNETNEVNILLKTKQTLNDFMDSVMEIPIYENLKYVDRQKLQEFWDKSCVDCPVHIFSTYYFDIRKTEALLIENRALGMDSISEEWVHFVSALPNGQRMITLSLRTEQLADNSCFKFVQFLDEDQSKLLHDAYKKQAFNQSNSEICRQWRKGNVEYFTPILGTFDILNYPPCWSFTTSSGSRLIGVSDSEKLGSLHQSMEPQEQVTTMQIEQIRGHTFYFFSYETGDSVFFIKTNTSFQNAYQTLMNEPDLTTYLHVDSTSLSRWWETATLGDTLRESPQEITFWKDAPKHAAAVYFQLGTDEFNVPKGAITDLVFYTMEEANKVIYLSYNYQMAKHEEEYYGAILSELNHSIQNIEPYLNPQLTWNPLQHKYHSQYTFSRLQKKLNLINITPEI
jgi:hypothetical protein